MRKGKGRLSPNVGRELQIAKALVACMFVYPLAFYETALFKAELISL